MIGGSQCEWCKHFIPAKKRGDEPMCAAFPDGIPHVIFLNKHDHRCAYPGDHGIRFEPKNEEVAARFRSKPGEPRQPCVVAEEAAYLNPGMPIYEPNGEGERAMLKRAAESHVKRLQARKSQ